MANEHVITLQDSNFENEVLQSEVPVLVDFWAPWCGPCLRLAPMLEQLAARYAGRLIVGKIDTDQHQAMASSLGVRSIPLLAFRRDSVGRL